MAHAARSMSPKERRDAKNARILIGREDQQDLFTRSLLQPEHREAKLIFSISGQGGVGKTTLLKEFRRIAEGHGDVVAYVDEGMVTNRVDDVPEALHRLVEDLERQGCKFDEFRKQYKAYRIKKQEMEAEPEAPKGFVGDGVRGVMKIGIEAGKGALPFGSMIDSEMVASKMGEMANYGFERFRNRDEERLMRETQEVLTPLFLEGMGKVAIDKTLVLLLDTYEVTGTFLDEWVRSLLEERFGALGRSVLVCMAGRSPIDANAWAGWEDFVSRSPLEPFTEEQAREFLAQKGILSEAVISEIWKLSSGGLPLLISMMAASAPKQVDAVVDPCVDAVDRFLKWETDGAKRSMALEGACARVLDEDVAGAMGDCGFEWLRGCAFVVRDGGRWRYHSVVRELMVRYQWQRSRSRWSAVHAKLAAFYEVRRSALGLEVGKETEDQIWREYSLEWIYHTICAAPQASAGLALNGFLMALKRSRDFSIDWAETIVQAGGETACESIYRWGQRLKNGMIARQEERYEDVIVSLTEILGEHRIEMPLAAVALYERGQCFACIKRYDESISDLEKAIVIQGDIPIYHIILGMVYNAYKKHGKSINSHQNALRLNPNIASTYHHLGITYFDCKEFKIAMQYQNKAIEIDPDFKEAFLECGEIFKIKKEYKLALANFEKSIEIDNEYYCAIIRRGLIFQILGNFEQSKYDFNRAIELAPDQDWYLYLRALTYQKLNNPTEAQTDLQTAIVLAQAKQAQDSIDWQNNFNLALYYLAAGQVEESHGLYDRASEASTDFIEMAIRDLDDYLMLFPDRLQAREVCDRLSALV